MSMTPHLGPSQPIPRGGPSLFRASSETIALQGAARPPPSLSQPPVPLLREAGTRLTQRPLRLTWPLTRTPPPPLSPASFQGITEVVCVQGTENAHQPTGVSDLEPYSVEPSSDMQRN